MLAVNLISEDTTQTSPHFLTNAVPPDVPAPKVLTHHNDHSQPLERLFIGPMPSATLERNLEAKGPGGPKKHWCFSLHPSHGSKSHDEGDDNDNDIIDYVVPERHAFRYFIQRGGREEDWGSQESLRKRVKREMVHQWKKSGWAPLRTEKNGATRPERWVGRTFRVGHDFMGNPMQIDLEAVQFRSTENPEHPPWSIASMSEPLPPTSNTSSAQTYNTASAHSDILPPTPTTPSSFGDPQTRDSRTNGSDVALIPSFTLRKTATLLRSSSSPLLRSQAPPDTQKLRAQSSPDNGHGSRLNASEPAVFIPRTPMPVRSALHRLREDGVSKTVQFSAIPQSQIEPVSPVEVLARGASSAPNTSASAAISSNRRKEVQGDALRFGDVIRRGKSARMLVRRSQVASGNVGIHFDAEEAVKLRDFHSYEWKEFLVVWRKRQLELYEDYSIPGKEMILGHKHLACVIPLQKPDTHLSLYSFVDFTFCLSCKTLRVSKSKSRTASTLGARMPFHWNIGTDVFVFKAKTRTMGIDWIWELWRQFGNDIPQTFEVYCPAIETRVKLHMPEYDATGGDGYNVFTKDCLVDLCREALRNLPAWDYLMEEPVRRGAHLELCWRKGSMLDWIRWETDEDGKKRDWAAVYGLCLGKPHEITHLEIRVGEHRPTTITLNDGIHLREPPAVEGYLYRIKPNSQSRTQVYLSTHGGCLFSIHPSRAYPPRPPIPVRDDIQPAEDFYGENEPVFFRDLEVQRGAQQVLQADAYIDFRSIMAVRRAFQLTVTSRHSESSQIGPSPQLRPDYEPGHDEEEDEGGDSVLAQVTDKPALRMRRSFELLMRTGHVVRFETYSCAVALEWIEHLGRLIEYWTYRHRLDAAQEMELIQATTARPNPMITPIGEQRIPERPPDYDQSSECLPSFWNWCVVDGCLSVVRTGRLFLRRSLRGQYRSMQLVLVPGHLIQFHITSNQASYHRRSKTISLLDAYICSGHYATQSLPADEFPTTQDPLPRRFQDSLESHDHELDTVFLIWYRPHPIGATTGNVSKVSIPPLKAKHNVIVLKARSKLERDAWCWALNAEIERLSRKTCNRGMKARDGRLAHL